MAGTKENWNRPARVLCLDGGGVRGLSSLMILRGIMDKIADDEDAEVGSLKPCDYFDLICGTSTGGLIAILLGRLRYTVQEAIDVYVSLSAAIFAKDRSISFLGSSIRLSKGGQGRFDARILENKIKELVSARCNGNADERLHDQQTGQSGPGIHPCHVAVVAVFADNLNNPQMRLFKSYDRNENCKIWEAARATSAAPTFFDAIEFGQPPVRYIDAGIGYNNPAQVVFDEVQEKWPARKIGVFVSLGTGKQSSIPTPRSSSNFGLRTQAELVKALSKLATSATRTHDQMWRRFKLMSANTNIYFRFEVDAGGNEIGLEEWKRLSELASLTQGYLEQVQIKHEKTLCADMVRRLSRRSKPYELSAQSFMANSEQTIDTEFKTMRYWYREKITAAGYPLDCTVPPEFEHSWQTKAKPVGEEILSLRRVAMLLVRAQAFNIVPGKYNVKWLFWFWSGQDTENSQAFSKSFPTKARNVNSICERTFPTASPGLTPPDKDSGFFHCANLRLSVGRAAKPEEYATVDFNPHDHPDFPQYLLKPGYYQKTIDWGYWNTLRNTGWAEAGGTIVEVQDDGYLAFMISMDWEPRWLGGVSFGGLRLEPVME